MEHQSEKAFTPVQGLTEGNNWSKNSDGSWFIPNLDLPADAIDDSDGIEYLKTFEMDEVKNVRKCAAPDTIPTGMPPSNQVQNDTGANANITSDLSILSDVQWVEPVACE